VTLRIRRIEQARDFVALELMWSRLIAESGQTSPFLSYDWFWCCWHGVWPQRRPEILVVEEGDTAVAIIPLMRWRARVHGLPIRYLSFLEWPHSPTADLVTANRHEQVIKLFLDHLISRSDWDIARLQKLPVTSPTVGALEHALPGRLPWRRDGDLVCPDVAIDGDWDRFYRTMSTSVRHTHQHTYAQLQRAGDLRLEEHRLIDLQGPLLQEMLAVINPQTHRTHGITPMPRQLEFFRALTQRAVKNGWLSLWTLKLNSHIIAIEYQLRSHGSVQVLAAGEDPSYRTLLPWPELNLAILRTLFQSGCTCEYSLGPAVQADRLWWANGHRQMVHLKLYRPSLYTRLLAQLEGTTVWEAG
jgi:CelD/BcsL family acetyltransferase involved in cellulose biosynthesis